MPVHRLTARSLLIALAAAAVLVAPATAGSAARGAVPTLIFPIVGKVQYSDDFGDPRGQGSHEGNDILADRKAPVVAVEAGKVVFWTTSASAGCMLYLYGKSGTTYLYIHLNNDLTMKNDNRGKCVAGTSYAPGLADGQEVKAGELIGFVGDSGDANGIHPHLHFEVHPGGGKAVSPYRFLKAATPLTSAGEAPAAGQSVVLTRGLQ
jgi:murein DD-endopeptidase MepM/ murein hydrolase activator NlpD